MIMAGWPLYISTRFRKPGILVAGCQVVWAEGEARGTEGEVISKKRRSDECEREKRE